ncbi:MAG: hypothetical protein KDA17_06880, partial [Candidatus Saccharibacteria bacterium]|nr:hypothetical protein [Candidatus Saccharibacteria bacterium]
RGNCVSMPLLFLALGERLDLELTLSTAPLHFLVKYTDDQTQQTYNLEATSGAGFTRDSWYQKKAPMTDKAIANGVYLKPLSPLEVRAVLAGIVVEHLIETERYEDAIAVSDVILEAYPEHAYVWIKKATAYYHLLRTEFRERYPNERDIPEEKLARATFLYQQNQLSFEHAEQLGWQAPELE